MKLHQPDFLQRLEIAKVSSLSEKNCLGFVFYMLGLTKNEVFVDPLPSARIERKFQIISSFQIPSTTQHLSSEELLEVDAIGFYWGSEGGQTSFYEHMVYVGHVGTDTSIYERPHSMGSVRPVDLHELFNRHAAYADYHHLVVRYLIKARNSC